MHVNPLWVYIQGMTHLFSSSTDSHHLLSPWSGPRLCDQHGTTGWSGFSQRGVQVCLMKAVLFICYMFHLSSFFTSFLGSPSCLSFFSGWPHLQLRKAIEGSVTVTGVKVRPPLASFRDSGNTTNVSEVTELHKLCIRHRGLSLPREPNPPNVEDQPDLQYKEIPVNFSDETNVQFEASDITNPLSELPLQESPSFTEDQSEFTFDCSPSHTEESELACDFDPSNQTPEPDEMEQEEAPPSLNNSQSEPGGEGSTGHTEDQSEWSDPHCRLMNVDVSYVCWGHTQLQVQPRYSWYDSERVRVSECLKDIWGIKLFLFYVFNADS